MYETTQTSIANDSLTAVGGASNVDRTFSFTPTVTGTYRLKVNLIVTVTASGSAFANDNTDNGNFGSTAPSRLAGTTLTAFTPGLVAVGCNLSAPTHSPAGSLVPFTTNASSITTLTNSFPFSVGTQASPDSSESLLLSYRNGADTQFRTTTITATASATKTDPGVPVDNTDPIAATAINLHLSFNNSLLSTSLSGAGIPWSFIKTSGIPAGWSAVTSNAIGASEIKTSSSPYTLDPRVTLVLQAQDQFHGSSTYSAGNNFLGNYVISASTGFMWVTATNAAAAGVQNLTMTQQIKNATTVVFTDTTHVTAVTTGRTPDPGVDFTVSIIAPSGSRTQNTFINAPSAAVGLDGSGQTQTLTFSSAFTANLSLLVGTPVVCKPGQSVTFYLQTAATGVLTAPDTLPTWAIMGPTTAPFTTTNSGNFLNSVDNTATINGPNYYVTVNAPGTEGRYVFWPQCTLAGATIRDKNWSFRVSNNNFDPTFLEGGLP